MNRVRTVTWFERILFAILPVVMLPCMATDHPPGAKRKAYTYVDEVGRSWCGTVGYVEANGPGGVSFGWFIFDAEPRRLVHVPMADLVAGCAR